MRRKICVNVPKEILVKYNKELKAGDIPIKIYSGYVSFMLQCPAKYKKDFKALIVGMKKAFQK